MAEGNRVHLLRLPAWLLVIRIFQLVFAVILLGLCGFGVSFSTYSGTGLGIFQVRLFLLAWSSASTDSPRRRFAPSSSLSTSWSLTSPPLGCTITGPSSPLISGPSSSGSVPFLPSPRWPLCILRCPTLATIITATPTKLGQNTVVL